jgi:nucleotide-binding universal stress UspA family protein
MVENIIVLNTTTSAQAKVIISYLESAQIDCFLQEGDKLKDGPMLDLVTILIKKKDLEKADRVLKGFNLDINISNENLKREESYTNLFIIPVDFSSASENSCYYALELATKFKARIKLIHTYGIPDIRPFTIEDTDFYQGTYNLQANEIRENAEIKLNELIHKLKTYIKQHSLEEIPIVHTLINGSPDEITLYSAELDKASLIIIGISGKDVRTFEPTGKITSRIIEKSSVPILIVPEDSKFVNIDQLKNILYLTAFDE